MPILARELLRGLIGPAHGATEHISGNGSSHPEREGDEQHGQHANRQWHPSVGYTRNPKAGAPTPEADSTETGKPPMLPLTPAFLEPALGALRLDVVMV